MHAYPDAQAALAGLDTWVGPIDLLLTDVSMPGELDGIALAAVVAERRPEIPVVLMSGDAGSLERATGAPGVSATLAKPFTLEALCEALARAARR
ncbi:MAG TPA: response regulator [Candidatus Limnocylindrales bacterium]